MSRLIASVRGSGSTTRINWNLSIDKPRLLKRAAELAREIVARRVDAGIDRRDAPFATYSARYLKRRQRKGLGARVNLRWSGDMMNNLRVIRSNSSQSVLGWHSGLLQARARKLQTGQSGPKREFLGISPEDRKKLAAAVQRELPNLLKRRR